MIYELIQPNHIYNSERDLDNDLDKWIQEESICFNIKISQQELHNIEDKIERNCIRASCSKYHAQMMDLLRLWRSTLRDEINHLRYATEKDFIINNGYYCYDSQIGKFFCTIEHNTNNRPTLYVEYIRYKTIRKTYFNGNTYKIKLTESQLHTIIHNVIQRLLIA